VIRHPEDPKQVSDVQNCCGSDPATENTEANPHRYEFARVDFYPCRTRHHQEICVKHGAYVNHRQGESNFCVGLEKDEPETVDHHVYKEQVADIFKY